MDRASSDRALVEACLSGDEEAWEALVAKFRPFVARVAEEALTRCGAEDPRSRADDVAGDVFAELVENDKHALTRFGPPWSLASWLAIIARRRAMRVARRDQRAPRGLEEPERVAAGGRTPASEVGEVDRYAHVREHLAQLSPRDRLALQLFYEGGRSYQEVAAALDLPVERIGTLLARARKRLAKALGLP
ncbi:MAG: sigma-70 family RNA polymerase sigma factor [Planctomycetes bacterium]|nr:sigma-70 family RNA polymerase sigma factor [Planctomycetota bacterium]